MTDSVSSSPPIPPDLEGLPVTLIKGIRGKESDPFSTSPSYFLSPKRAKEGARPPPSTLSLVSKQTRKEMLRAIQYVVGMHKLKVTDLQVVKEINKATVMGL